MPKFDPDNPPKFCPKCQKMGISTKVKMRRLCPDYEKVLICKHDQVKDTFSHLLTRNVMEELLCSVYLALHHGGVERHLPRPLNQPVSG